MRAASFAAWGREEAKPFRTAEIYWMLCAAVVALAYYNTEVVMTRAVFHSILGAQLDTQRIDVQYELTRKWAVLGYVLVPPMLAAEAGFLAFITQLFVLLVGAEAPLGKLFRVAMLAKIPLLAGAAARSVWLGSLPAAAITRATLNVVPWSLGNMLFDPSQALSPGYAFASAINPVELAWGVIMTAGVARIGGMSRRRSAAIVLAVWLGGQLTSFVVRSFLVS